MYQPAIPMTGYAGFKLFERTAARQLDAFARSADVKRDVAWFIDNVSSAKTAADLVGDRRLLKVALGAFGLSEEINKRAFIRRILEGGTDSLEAPANRMPDPRWRRFAAVFGYGDIGGAQTAKPGFAPALADQFVKRAFEAAVGDQDEAFRLALNFRREVADIAASSGTDRSGWLKMLGQRPVRAVLEAALGLPASMATLDIDKQVGIVSARARAVFGADSPKAFGDATLVEKTLQRFFARREIEGGGLASSSARGSTALTLLSSGLGAISAPNLVASNTLRR